jgi:D-3-phosphoglycerate dehydrogenase
MRFKILVADEIHETGLSALSSSPSLDVEVKLGLDTRHLQEILPQYDAVVIGNDVRIQAEALDSCPGLKVIAKAGVDFENIDIQAATRRGVIVMNAPASHIVSAAEHTIALITAAHRHLPTAVDSMKQGKWEKKKFQGREMAGKTLGIIGYGKTGAVVARYAARGLRMNVLIHDAVIPSNTIKHQGFRPVSLEELLCQSDVISLHVPLTSNTKNLLNSKAFDLMKPGAIVINIGKAGLIHENSLWAALESGKVACAGIDAHFDVHAKSSLLLNHPKVIATPDLSVATDEARAKISQSIADSLTDFFENGTLGNAVNVPIVDPALRTKMGPYAELARRLGMFIGGLSSGSASKIEVSFRGELVDWDVRPLTTSVLTGFLNVFKGTDVNLVNANVTAQECGIQVHETILKESSGGRPSITIEVLSTDKMSIKVEGVLIRRFGEEPRIIGLNEFVTEAVPAGPMLIVKNRDIPGMIAGITGILAQKKVNIAQMNLSRNCAGGTAISITNIDSPADEETLERIRNIDGILSVDQIILEDLPELDVCIASN